MNEQEACERLRQGGMAEPALSQLLQLRRKYDAEEVKLEELAAFRRLQFVRWLVRTGRLTEQGAEECKLAQEDEGLRSLAWRHRRSCSLPCVTVIC